MVQVPAHITGIIERYLIALFRNGMTIRQAVLFGSYARGTSHEWSDIDIALVSDVFSGNRIDDKNMIRKITLSVSSAIEALPFAPDDFTDHNPLAREIKRTGISLELP